MALFNKLFNKRKTTKPSSSQTSSSQFPFNKEQVRIILFRECDWRGRRLLFDSSAIEPVTTPPVTSQQQPNNSCVGNNTSSPKPSPLKLDKNNIEYYEGKAYKYGRPSPDFNHIGEMVFGSVAISFRGTSFKVHWLQAPSQTLCSQVFLAPVQSFSSSSSSSTNTHSSSGQTHASSSNYGSDMMSEISGSISETNSLNSFSVSESAHNVSLRTNPLDVPTTALSLDNDDFKFISQSMGDSSGYNSSELWCGASNAQKYPFSSARSSLASIYSDIENHSRKLSISSSVSEYPSCDVGHLNRRIMKNLSTSFENVSTITENMSMISENNYYTVCGTSNLTGLSDGCVTKLRRNSEVVDTRRKATSGDALSSNSSTLHHRSKRPRLAVAICINMSECMENEMFIFCSEHMALLEQMIYRLRASAENAYINRTHFQHLMMKCWHTTSQWLVDLFSAPRLINPIWLSLSTGVKNSNQLANLFMHDLCSLLNTADTKDTNFFISTLLTAVLTHHLGWVGTVAPLMTSNVRENLNKNGANPLISKLIEEENFKLSEISKIYPYNALWAQLGDLYGAITNPTKLSKTVICGNDASVKTIEKLLNIMTYFIRCSEIKRNAHSKIFDKDELNKTVNNQLNQRSRTFQSLRNNSLTGSLKKGLSRTSTNLKDLSKAFQEQDDFQNFSNEDPETYRLLVKTLKKNVMNDIPKVLAFRDSRFVQQELRIGNKSMDTGIEMSDRDRKFMISRYHVLKSDDGANICGDRIKLTVTRPDSIEEAIELEEDEVQFDFFSLSHLITENSLGGAPNVVKMFIEREQLNKNNIPINLEQIQKKKKKEEEEVEEEDDDDDDDDDGNVVFVLGDDEKLVGLKTSPSVQTLCNDEPSTSSNMLAVTGTKKKICKHHRKHSGVKFNFEKYPQIATNYMKSKNLEFNELEKGLKLEHSNFPSTLTLNSQTDSESEEECECSRYESGLHYLQTPSNATELEFTCDSNYLTPPSSRNSDSPSPFSYLQTLDENKELKSVPSSNAVDETKIIEIPMLDSIKSRNVQDEILKPGFTSSLFTSVSDHYIADMILQGVTTPLSKWELQLKQDLSISSYCGVLEQAQAENIAIVANIDKWDVRLISSHTNVLPSHNNSANGIIGMSQLVASMLECVQAMFNAGIPEYQCLSFIESKLREMYLQSETLAAFLMETEFCSLSTLTTTLNLSVNDIPLLMSIASIHSPQVTKKYGITFR